MVALQQYNLAYNGAITEGVKLLCTSLADWALFKIVTRIQYPTLLHVWGATYGNIIILK